MDSQTAGNTNIILTSLWFACRIITGTNILHGSHCCIRLDQDIKSAGRRLAVFVVSWVFLFTPTPV